MFSRLILLVVLASQCLGQGVTHKEITLDLQTLQRYVGAYDLDGDQLLITVDKDHLSVKAAGEPAFLIFPESKTMFFLKVAEAQLEFTKDDAQGRPTEIILHQGSQNIPGKRLDDAQTKRLIEANAAVAKRIKDQTAAPGSEAALRKLVADLGAGKPDYNSMGSDLAEATRRQLPNLQSMISKLGAIQSAAFQRVGPGGADIYLIALEKGALEGRIRLGADGKIDGAAINITNKVVVAPLASLRPKLPGVDAMISAELARLPVGSVTAGVVAGKGLIWSKSYGNADMEKKTPADDATVYRIGSITKMFTALMLEQLVDAGKVHLSDPVEKYFPEIKSVQGRFPDAPPITLIQLATHTSGLGREPDDTATYTRGSVADWEKTLIAALPHTHYIHEPGTRFSYSNIGYAILGAALSRAAGEPYTEYVPKHILQPLGMTHSALEQNSSILPHLAKGYVVMGPNQIDSETPQREGETGRGYKVPNGAIYTTVGDMAHFASFLMDQGPESVLKTSALECFQTEMIVPADVGLTGGYGIGFDVERREGYVAFEHNGAVAGYTAMLIMNRSKGIAVIVLSNGAVNPSGLGDRILDMLSR
ncbi:MAG TPA: serine hydrolase [Candidatus Angelobacter sp.]|nr:serine hydrolase [Candidatus Angelobacter sp.]